GRGRRAQLTLDGQFAGGKASHHGLRYTTYSRERPFARGGIRWRRLYVDVGGQRIVLDEFAAGFDHVAHQLGEDVVGLVDLLDLHLQQRASFGVERGFPELLRVHLAQAFVALQVESLAAGLGHGLEQVDGPVDGRFRFLAAEQAGPGIGLLQPRRIFVELARVDRAEQGVIEDRGILHAAHGALEQEALALDELADPAAFYLFGQGVEALGDVFRRACGLFRIGKDFGPQHAGNRSLLDHAAVVAAVQVAQHGADQAGILDQRKQVAPGAVGAGSRLEHAFIDASSDQIVVERALVLEVLLGLAARNLVERRLRDIEMAVIDDVAHLPVEEGEQQRADMGAVDVGVRHHDDLVIAQLVDREVIADAGAERGDQRADLLAREHLVGAYALDVEDLAAQRQHGLEFAVAALLGAAAGRVALDDEELGFGGVLFLAVGELAGQRGD